MKILDKIQGISSAFPFLDFPLLAPNNWCPRRFVARASAVMAEPNPLLQKKAPFSLPLFDAVKAEHVVPAMSLLLSELNTDIDALEKASTLK